MLVCVLLFTALLAYTWNHFVRLVGRTLPSRSFPSTRDDSPLERIRFVLQPPKAPLSQLLLERSTANARISRALGLSNTFANPDPLVHSEFVRRSRVLLREVQVNGWTRFHQTCALAVQSTLRDWLEPNIRFDKFVQVVVLRSILVGLLNVGKDVEELEYSSLSVVATLINDLWTLSKSGAPLPSDLQQQLNDHLRHLIPASADFGNPIDFVVPTWETMWRVCATTVARAQECEEYKYLFRELLRQTDSLTSQQFVAAGSQGFSVRGFVEEVMRLHPPVKRISRLRAALCDATSRRTIIGRIWARINGTEASADGPVRHSADVEAVLRAQSIWGHDALSFDPRSHRADTPQRKEAQQVVFGFGHLRCVAASWAPDAAAVISATILEECRELRLARPSQVPGLDLGNAQVFEALGHLTYPSLDTSQPARQLSRPAGLSDEVVPEPRRAW
ncbi:hypothetical protein D9756_008911 [Leucocoprinus leucothites]|uniref:Cytochrome P450 n=1 Tax=Leucocoprinus leucothites TaxID=201217 RepID=A0A8H5CY38_9AGAR|nr:hypothetical protein D9756_008911 [Leucoagaricus leucothites]